MDKCIDMAAIVDESQRKVGRERDRYKIFLNILYYRHCIGSLGAHQF